MYMYRLLMNNQSVPSGKLGLDVNMIQACEHFEDRQINEHEHYKTHMPEQLPKTLYENYFDRFFDFLIFVRRLYFTVTLDALRFPQGNYLGILNSARLCTFCMPCKSLQLYLITFLQRQCLARIVYDVKALALLCQLHLRLGPKHQPLCPCKLRCQKLKQITLGSALPFTNYVCNKNTVFCCEFHVF